MFITVFVYSKGHGIFFILVEHNEVSSKAHKGQKHQVEFTTEGSFLTGSLTLPLASTVQTELVSTCVDR